MIKFLFFSFNFDSFSEHFGVFFEMLYGTLIFRGFLPELVDCNFQLWDSGFLDIVGTVLIWKCLNKSSQLFFLSADVNIIGLEVLILLLSQHLVQALIKSSDNSRCFFMLFFNFLPAWSFEYSISLSSISKFIELELQPIFSPGWRTA